MLGVAQLRQVLARELRDGNIRTTRRNSDQIPTHTTLDKLWMVEGDDKLQRLEQAYANDMCAGTGVYMAEFHPPIFALHLHFLFMGRGPTPSTRAVSALCAELSAHAAAPGGRWAWLRGEAGQWACGCTCRRGQWTGNRAAPAGSGPGVAAPRLPLLAPQSRVDPDAYRRPVPWLACPAMVACDRCRRVSSKMEHCAQCGMTGWAQAPCSRMQPWHAWKEGGTDIELSAVTAALLRQLRLRPPPSSAAAAFPSLPAATPPLPLAVQVRRREGVGRLAQPAHRRVRGVRGALPLADGPHAVAREGVDDCDIVTPRGATPATSDTSLMLLRGAFRAMLWMVAGRGDLVKAKDNPGGTAPWGWRGGSPKTNTWWRCRAWAAAHPMGVYLPHAPCCA